MIQRLHFSTRTQRACRPASRRQHRLPPWPTHQQCPQKWPWLHRIRGDASSGFCQHQLPSFSSTALRVHATLPAFAGAVPKAPDCPVAPCQLQHRKQRLRTKSCEANMFASSSEQSLQASVHAQLFFRAASLSFTPRLPLNSRNPKP